MSISINLMFVCRDITCTWCLFWTLQTQSMSAINEHIRERNINPLRTKLPGNVYNSHFRTQG